MAARKRLSLLGPEFGRMEAVLGILSVLILCATLLPGFLHGNDVDAKSQTRASLDVLRASLEAFASKHERAYPEEIPHDPAGRQTGLLTDVPREGFTPSSRATPDPTPASEITPLDIRSSNVGGWMYNSRTGEVRINKAGVDFEGVAFGAY